MPLWVSPWPCYFLDNGFAAGVALKRIVSFNQILDADKFPSPVVAFLHRKTTLRKTRRKARSFWSGLQEQQVPREVVNALSYRQASVMVGRHSRNRSKYWMFPLNK
jgi:hypothetical protein